MLDNIREHSIVVAKIAHLIAETLSTAGARVSVEATLAAALLHDIGKTLCLRNGGDHAALGRVICLRHKFDEIADIIGEHVILQTFDPQDGISEKEIVYYADKRVNHSSVVSLDERLRYILERYGRDNPLRRQWIISNFATCRAVERKLFAHLHFTPSEVGRLIM
ncbi:MAG: HDIG domain-containing protein [Deltaproteobacteria bacterium]|nr:HDIG domain-containing protein [Deltaproteobacteria bacterium]MBW2069633.1 HDIG domain-containing protein [Deltaproteobacteria bacterium]